MKSSRQILLLVGTMCLAQVSMSIEDPEIDALLDQVLGNPSVRNMPFDVTREGLVKALSAMDQLGTSVIEELGDVPYKALHQ